ncbi:MAG: ATP-binding cassette domain-containing protein [Burkholderiaceae bacterium]
MPAQPNTDVLLEVRDLEVHFPLGGGLFGKKRHVRAVDGISFKVRRTTFGIGESGSGKSTTALAVMRLVEHRRGDIRLDGEDVGNASGDALRHLRRRFQMVFQDPMRRSIHASARARPFAKRWT